MILLCYQVVLCGLNDSSIGIAKPRNELAFNQHDNSKAYSQRDSAPNSSLIAIDNESTLIQMGKSCI